MTPYNVLSICGGIECGRVALERAGIPVGLYFSSEIDKYARMVCAEKFPEIIQIGDMKKVSVKQLCLSEAYAYICGKYFKNEGLHGLQSIVSEREMLHRIDKEQVMAACFGTQIPNEETEVPEHSALQINDGVWFFRNKMGDSEPVFHVARGGARRDSTNKTAFGDLCKHSFWWNGNGQFKPGATSADCARPEGEGCFGGNEKEVIKDCESPVFNEGIKGYLKEICLRVCERPSKKGEVLRRNIENRQGRKVEKVDGGTREAKAKNVQNALGCAQPKNEQCGVDEVDGYFSAIYSQTQVTVVECEWGIIVFGGCISLCYGGTPCQGFSMAGKRLNFDDPRSVLVFEFFRILHECQAINPGLKFMLENVPMDSAIENAITLEMGIRPYKSDAALVGPQRRVRTFWTNIKTKKIGLFGEEVPDIPQPKDLRIFVRDILQENVPEKYRVTGKRLEYMLARVGKYVEINGDKAQCFMAKTEGGWQGDLVEETGFFQTERGNNKGGFSAVKKSPTFGANSCEHNQHILSFPCQMRRTEEGRKMRKAVESGEITARRDEQMAYLPNPDGKSGTFTLKTDDNLVFVKDKAGCHTAGANSAGNHSQMDLIPDGLYFRRYTPVEVCRLFGLPDDYFLDSEGNPIVSESQQYRLMGNGWQVDQVAHIFSFLPELK